MKLMLIGRKSSSKLLVIQICSNRKILSSSVYDEIVGTEADMKNLDAFMHVSPIPTTIIHKDHPVEQIIGDLNLTPQTRRMTKNLEEHGRASIIQATRVWTLVDLPNSKRPIGTKWVYRNKKDKRGIVIKNKARLMDVKSAFLYGKIKEEVYVCQPLGFDDPDFSDKVYKVEKALYGQHQAPRAWYETLSTYLLDSGCVPVLRYQSTKNVHLYAVKKTFSLDNEVTTRSVAIPWVLFVELISWQCKKQTVVTNSTTEAEYVAASSCCGQVKTVNGEQQLQALVDGKKIIITEATVPQSSVPSDPTNVADEAVNEEPSMQLKELMDFCTKLQQRVLNLENTKTTQAQEITSLKKRVKKLEKKGGSITHKLRRLYKVGRSARVVSSDEASLGNQEDASK
ncbi:putative ribonuclease H-like domain-containing protein [Tanacetum coccineum]